MKAPQIIYIILTVINLLAAANMHGKKKANTNFWNTIIASGITIGILLWGGFFN